MTFTEISLWRSLSEIAVGKNVGNVIAIMRLIEKSVKLGGTEISKQLSP